MAEETAEPVDAMAAKIRELVRVLESEKRNAEDFREKRRSYLENADLENDEFASVLDRTRVDRDGWINELLSRPKILASLDEEKVDYLIEESRDIIKKLGQASSQISGIGEDSDLRAESFKLMGLFPPAVSTLQVYCKRSPQYFNLVEVAMFVVLLLLVLWLVSMIWDAISGSKKSSPLAPPLVPSSLTEPLVPSDRTDWDPATYRY